MLLRWDCEGVSRVIQIGGRVDLDDPAVVDSEQTTTLVGEGCKTVGNDLDPQPSGQDQ